MSKIRIKNVGPVKEGLADNDGWIDIKKVTVFIGRQGSGKSTVAKLISAFTWMEKALNRGDFELRNNNDVIARIRWQGLEHYLGSIPSIEYVGDKLSISYEPAHKTLSATAASSDSNYIVPKIMYVPAERNFLTTIKNAFGVTGLPGPLQAFADELKRAQIEIAGQLLPLPLREFSYEYNQNDDISYVVGNGYKINLTEASSGLQSVLPLYLVSRNLALEIERTKDPSTTVLNSNLAIRRDREISAILLDKTLMTDEKERRTSEVFAKYHNRCFVNIVEEPEQNLYPSSQRDILNSLLEFNNLNPANKLIMTTHSPYLINDITLCVEAHGLLKKIRTDGAHAGLEAEVAGIVPLTSTIDPDDLAIYELDDITGTIKLLKGYEGLPPDDNKLNEELGLGNDRFIELLEIENKLQS